MSAPYKYPTSTQQVLELIRSVGDSSMSVKEMMIAMDLKDRVNFLRNYLHPAMQEGFLKLLYPENPKHPRQKYLLTVKGLAVFNEMSE